LLAATGQRGHHLVAELGEQVSAVAKAGIGHHPGVEGALALGDGVGAGGLDDGGQLGRDHEHGAAHAEHP
jgi:hypothetical protein